MSPRRTLRRWVLWGIPPSDRDGCLPPKSRRLLLEPLERRRLLSLPASDPPWPDTLLAAAADTTPPSAPGTPDMLDTGDTAPQGVTSGPLKTDNITRETSPTFRFSVANDASGIQGYWWALDDATPETGGTRIAKPASGWGSTVEVTPTVPQNGPHVLYVKAVDDSPAHNIGPLSGLRFTIDTVAPETPILVNPIGGAAISDGTPTLDWSASNDAASGTYRYRLQVDNFFLDDARQWSSPDRAVWVAGSTTEWDVDPALSSGSWNWRVFAEDHAGNQGSWTAGAAFSVGAAPGPTIGRLLASPPVVLDGNSLQLKATEVRTPARSVASVAFYREDNGIAGLQVGVEGDVLLQTDTTPGDGWTAVVSVNALDYGGNTFYAHARDSGGNSSADGMAAASAASFAAESASDAIGDDIGHAFDFSTLDSSGASTTSILGNGPHGAGDVDLYQFTIPWAATVSAAASPYREWSTPLTLNGYVRLFDADGVDLSAGANRIAPETDSPSGGFLQIALPAGTYYVGISASPNRYYDPRTGQGRRDGDTTDWYRMSIVLEAPPLNKWEPALAITAQYDDRASEGFGQYLIGDRVADLNNTFTVDVNAPPGYSTREVVFDSNFNGTRDAGDDTDSTSGDGWTWTCNVSRLDGNKTLKFWVGGRKDEPGAPLEWSGPVSQTLYTKPLPAWMDPDPLMTSIHFQNGQYAVSSLSGERFGGYTPDSWPDWLAQRNGQRTWNGIYFGELVEAGYSLGGHVTEQKLRSVIGFSILGFGKRFEFDTSSRSIGSLTVDVRKLNQGVKDLDSLLPDDTKTARPSWGFNLPSVHYAWDGTQILTDDLNFHGQKTLTVELDARSLFELTFPPIIVPLTPIPLEFVVTPHLGLGFGIGLGWTWTETTGCSLSEFDAMAYISAGARMELEVLGGVFKGGLDATVTGGIGFGGTKDLQTGDWSFRMPASLGIDLDAVGSAFWGIIEGRLHLVDAELATNDLLGGLLSSAVPANQSLSEDPPVAPAPTILSPAVAQSASGGMAIAWSQVDLQGNAQPLLVQQRSASGMWGPTETVASGNRFRGEPALAYLPDGRLLALWSESKLDAASLPETAPDSAAGYYDVAKEQEILWSLCDGGVWSTPRALTDNALLDDQPAVAVRPDGTAVAVWRHASDVNLDAPATMDLYYAAFDGAAWSPPAVMSSDNDEGYGRAALTALDSGDVLAAWLTSADRRGETSDVRSSVLSAGTWSAPTLPGAISDTGGTVRQSLRLVTLPGQRVLAFWTEEAADGRTLRMAIRDPGTGAWRASTEVVAAQQGIGFPVITANESRVDVVWHAVDGDVSTIFAVSRDFAGNQGWTPPRPLTSPADENENWWPLAASDADGKLNLAYVQDPEHSAGATAASPQAALAAVTFQRLTLDYVPDLAVTDADVSLLTVPPVPNEANSVRVAVRNLGRAGSPQTACVLYAGDPDAGGSLIGSATIPVLAIGEVTELAFAWAPAAGTHDLWVVIDPLQGLGELDETNNRAHSVVGCIGAPTLSLDPSSDTGDLGDGWTVDTTPTLIGTTALNTWVVAFVDSQSSPVAQATVTGGSYTVTLPELTAGPHTIWVRAYDALGNPSAFSQPLSLVVAAESAAPAAPGLDPADDTGALGDAVTAIVRPRIRGTARPGANVELYCGPVLLGVAAADAAGVYSVTPEQDLSGSCSIAAVEVDGSGNRSVASPAFVLTIDTVPPRAESHEMAQSASALFIFFDEDVSTSLAVGDLVLTRLADGSRIDPAQMDFAYDPTVQRATWTFSRLPGGKLADGAYTATLAATGVVDVAGNLLDGNGDGAGGDAHSFTLAVGAAPSAPPDGVSASDDAFTDKVRVTWNAADGATAYEVWRNTSDDSAMSDKVSLQDVSGTSYDDVTAVAGTAYWYWVKAKNTAGVSDFSAADAGQRAVTAAQGLVLSATSVLVVEGSTSSFQVKLAAPPAGNVTVMVASQSGGDADLTASPASLTFTPGDWNAFQTVVISAAQDDDALKGTAVFAVSSSGLSSVNVTATEDDRMMTLRGTSADDRFEFRKDASANQYLVTLNGVTYPFSLDQLEEVRFLGGDGSDSALLVGTSGNESLTTSPGNATLGGADVNVHVEDTEEVVAEGGGGVDVAMMFGSERADRYRGTDQVGELRGIHVPFTSTAKGFGTIHVAGGAGTDRAEISGTVAKDRLFATYSYARLIGERAGGDYFFHRAVRFENVIVQGNPANAADAELDVARFRDSPHDDLFEASATSASMRCGRFTQIAEGFGSVVAVADSGGYDACRYAVGASDHVVTKDDRRVLHGDDCCVRAVAFEDYDSSDLASLASHLLSMENDADPDARLSAAQAVDDVIKETGVVSV